MQEISSPCLAFKRWYCHKKPLLTFNNYAAIEAVNLSQGGISYNAKLFGCSRDTISAGIEELDQEDELPGNWNKRPEAVESQLWLDMNPLLNNY